MKKAATVLIALALGATSAVQAQGSEGATATVAAQAAPVPAPSPAVKEQKVCRTERATGSLTRKRRICMTKAEWAELEAATHKGVGEMQRGAAGGQCVPSDPVTRAGC